MTQNTSKSRFLIGKPGSDVITSKLTKENPNTAIETFKNKNGLDPKYDM